MVAVVLFVAIVVPALAGLLGVLPGRWGRLLSWGWLTILGTVLSFLVLRRLPLLDWPAQVLALAGGGSIAWGFHRFDPARVFFRYLSPTPLILAGLFIFATPAGAMITDEGTPMGGPAHPSNPVPVVMIVLDEFPVASMIDPAGNLRSALLPNFARLAADGVWFRNAMTVQQQTEHSVPAMLTGINPSQDLAPFASQYPDNLFTALARSHRMVVDETITRLCPVAICQLRSTAGFFSRASGLAEDLGIIAGHVLLPEWMSQSLPAIDRSWGDFAAASADFDAIAAFNQAREFDPRLKLRELAESIAADSGLGLPGLYFAHALVPHNPWQFLPGGQSYPLTSTRVPGTLETGWGDNEWLVVQGWQRHLLQVQYVDRAIGEVIEAMEAAGIYQEALLIVVADHGIAFQANIEHWRRITPETVGEIAAIPLFVKAPGRAGGFIDDRRALTVDILPSIAEVLGFDLSWEVDGISLFGPDPNRLETTTIGPSRTVTYGVDGSEKLETAARLASWFPSGDPYQLVPRGAPSLVGKRIDEMVTGEAAFTFRINRPEWYEDVEASSDVIPVRITGFLLRSRQPEVLLGVAVNGVVGAVTRTYVEKDRVLFQAMVPPQLFVDGHNEVSVVWLSGNQTLLVPGRG
jgi:hypothetical protein